MSGIVERLAELSRRVTGVDLRLAAIFNERKSVAIEASQGGRTALKKVAELDQEEDQLRRSKTTYTLAADELDVMLREEEAAVAAGKHELNQAKARELGAALITLNLELDDLLLHTREAFERREGVLNALHRTAEGINARTAFKWASKENATAAAYFARLNRFLNLEPMQPSSHRPLSDANRVIPHN
jgi:hypothetical protein